MAAIDAYPSPVTDLDTEAQWETWVNLIQNSGVDPTSGTDPVKPSLDSGNRRVNTAAGGALIGGLYRGTDATEATSVPSASASNRVDRLVWRYDRTETSTAGDVIKPVVITGTAGSSTPPDIQRTTAASYDIHICRWTSQSNGALSGLVDERDWLHNRGSIPCYSYNRPPNAFGVMISELDTGIVRVGDGTGWRILSEDSGKVILSPSWPDYWRPNTDIVVYRRSGLVSLRVDVTRRTHSLNPGDGNSFPLICTLPAAYRPPVNWDVTYYADASVVGKAHIGYDDGRVEAAAGGNLAIGTRLAFATTFPATW